MENACTSPARTAIDRLVTIGRLHPFELRSDQIEHFIPAHRDEWFNAPSCPIALDAMCQPTLADHWPLDTACCVYGARDRLHDAAGVGVLTKRSDSHNSAVVDLGIIEPPV